MKQYQAMTMFTGAMQTHTDQARYSRSLHIPEIVISLFYINRYQPEIFLYKTWRQKGFFN